MLFSPLNALHLPHPLAQNNRRVATQRHKHGLSTALLTPYRPAPVFCFEGISLTSYLVSIPVDEYRCQTSSIHHQTFSKMAPASDQGMPISNEARLLFELENGLVTDSCDVVRCAGFSLDANYPPYISFTLCASKRNKRVAQVQYLIHL